MTERSDFITHISGDLLIYFGMHMQREVKVSHEVSALTSRCFERIIMKSKSSELQYNWVTKGGSISSISAICQEYFVVFKSLATLLLGLLSFPYWTTLSLNQASYEQHFHFWRSPNVVHFPTDSCVRSVEKIPYISKD